LHHRERAVDADGAPPLASACTGRGRAVRLASHAARHAAQGAIALGALPCLAIFGLPELAQSSITTMAVMLVPVASVGRSGLVPVRRRLIYRMLGCVTGGLFAALMLFASAGNAVILILRVCPETSGRIAKFSEHEAN
jgi:uncharacterized membrane protein YccC